MKPPSFLDEVATAKWREILPTLVQRGDADAAALDALTQYSAAWERWLRAQAEIGKQGAVIQTPQGFVASPWVNIAEKAQRQLRQWGDVLRITPSRKPRRKKKTSGDAFDKIINRV